VNAREETLVRLWHDHVPVEAIADTLGVTRQHVYKLASALRERGVHLDHRAPAGARALRPCGGTPFEQALEARRLTEAIAS
jgi:biotin operon repressor